MRLRHCGGCKRHVRPTDATCPFCGATPRAPHLASRGAVLIAGLMVPACQVITINSIYGSASPPRTPVQSPMPLPGCQEAVGSTATIQATAGAYAGLPVPASWNTLADDEAKVTRQINAMADARNEAWTTFKCIFPATVAAWRTTTGRTD